MTFERDSDNTFIVPARETETPSYWLVRFTSDTNQLSVYCVCSNIATVGTTVVLTVTETGSTTAVAANGEVQLSPPGDWVMTIWEQTSSTNIDPQNAAVQRQVHTELVTVAGDDIGAVGDPCPPCNDDVTVENSDATYTETVDCGDTLVLPDVDHTDSDGSTVTLPAQTPMVCTTAASGYSWFHIHAIGIP